MGEIENLKKQIEELSARLNDPVSSTSRRTMLANSLQAMLTHVYAISMNLSGWEDQRQEYKDFYVDKLSYKQVKTEKIIKYDLCSLFTNPRTNQPLNLTSKRFPIHW